MHDQKTRNSRLNLLVVDFLNMNGNEQNMTTSSNSINYEGIENQKYRFGMPAGFGEPDSSSISTGNSTLYQSQFQR